MALTALVLAGGEGTRLRPLTDTTPKPVLPLAGRPFLAFMLDWLAGHGVDRVVLSCGYRADRVAAVLGDRHGDLPLHYVTEPEPLGTAGPVRLALDERLVDDRLLVLNGDVLTDIDLSAQLAQHERTGAMATLALVAVEETASYGVVPTDAAGRVEAFLEKRSAGTGPPPTNRINAGAYVLEPAVAERIPPGRAVSFEREVFPGLVGAGLYGFAADGYWVDIGTPERYLDATEDLLAGRVESTLPPRERDGALIGRHCRVADAVIGPLSVLGDGCEVARGARVVRSALHERVVVGERCLVERSIVGADARIEQGAQVGPDAVVGPGAVVAAGERLGPGARRPAAESLR